jgi:hypothetical protein
MWYENRFENRICVKALLLRSLKLKLNERMV